MTSRAYALNPSCQRKWYSDNAALQTSQLASLRTVVCDTCGISLKTIMSPSRVPEVAIPRMVAMYLTRELLNAPYKVIARFWQRDHSSVIYAHQTILRYMECDRAFRERVAEIRAACAAELTNLNRLSQ